MLKYHEIQPGPIPSHAHWKNQVEHKHKDIRNFYKHLKFSMGKNFKDKEFPDILQNATHVSNIATGNKNLSAFEMCRGHTPMRVLGAALMLIDPSLHKQEARREARRIHNRMRKAKPVVNLVDVEPGDEVFVWEPSIKSGVWVLSKVISRAENSDKILCDDKKQPRTVSREHILRKVPKRNLEPELHSSYEEETFIENVLDQEYQDVIEEQIIDHTVSVEAPRIAVNNTEQGNDEEPEEVQPIVSRKRFIEALVNDDEPPSKLSRQEDESNPTTSDDEAGEKCLREEMKDNNRLVRHQAFFTTVSF